jgi:hypothetical protein
MLMTEKLLIAFSTFAPVQGRRNESCLKMVKFPVRRKIAGRSQLRTENRFPLFLE